MESFTYYCSLCECSSHAKCASQNIYDAQDHDHSFMLLKSNLFTCDACGVESKDVSCLCTTCQLQVHQKCSSSSFPLTVKQKGHVHKLNLTNSYPRVAFADKRCKICYQKLNKVFCIYNCKTCSYIAHIGCATREDLRDDDEAFVEHENQEGKQTFALGLVETKDGLISILDVKEINHLRKLQKKIKQLQYLSHPHYLILSNDELKSAEVCEGCVRPLTVPFYTCVDQCNYSLHKQCVQLRNEIKHPLHLHPLTLLKCNAWTSLEIFQCQACKSNCNGFVYKCLSCSFYIDVTCSLFSDTLKHQGHQCDLTLMPIHEEHPTKCSACGMDCNIKFKCEDCNFNLDLRCASLPATTQHECPKHNWDMRPFKLTYSSAGDEFEKFYCDMCEELRGKNDWFYYCEDCEYSAHPQCNLGEYLVNYGRHYQIRRHRHSVTLV